MSCAKARSIQRHAREARERWRNLLWKIVYEKYGFIGVETAVAPDMIDLRFGVIEGFMKSIVDPYNFIVMNLKGMGMLFAGELDVRQNSSGHTDRQDRRRYRVLPRRVGLHHTDGEDIHHSDGDESPSDPRGGRQLYPALRL